jgi:glycosidase
VNRRPRRRSRPQLVTSACPSLLVAAALLAASCSPASTSPSTTAGSSGPTGSTGGAATSASAGTGACAAPAALPWWNDRVFYEVFVRSFQDSDGDGIGDIKGLMSKLDYLNDGDPSTTTDLGVTGIWLMPIAESPSYHGYDVTDYTKVEPDYGTVEDVKALVEAAHDRGIAVIPDLVLNHTSVEHPWFVDSETAGSPHADWYRWSDTDPGETRTDGTPVWHPKDDRWYYGYFWEGMPDLNLANPAVTTELDTVADFWLKDVGVDGFRLDAIRYYLEDGPQLEDLPASKTWLATFKGHVDGVNPEAVLVGEAYTDTRAAASWLPAVDLTFDFGYASAMLTSVKSYSGAAARTALHEALEAYPPGQRGVFLTNHDQPRVMAELADPALARTAAELLLTSPGVPFVYYGEEVGLDGTKPDEQIRTPMPWTAKGPGVGFTTATPWEAPSAGFEGANVATENSDPASLLSTYRTLIQLRGAHSALSGGDAVVLDTPEDTVLAVVRRSPEETVLVITNLGITAASGPTLDLSPLAGCVPGGGAVAIYGTATVAPPGADLTAYRPVNELAPGQTLVIRLGD